MTPSSKIHNPAYFVLANSESRRDSRLAITTCVLRTYGNDVTIGKLLHPISDSSWAMAFAVTVCIIFCLVTKPKMVWIDTRRIITSRAVMANGHAIWYRSIMNEPAHSARNFQTVAFFANANYSVSSIISSNPNPATFSEVNFRPKTLKNSWCKTLFDEEGNGIRWVRNQVHLVMSRSRLFVQREGTSFV